MVKISLIILIILAVFNTLAGLIFSGYETFNFVFGDISLLLSGGLLHLLARSNAPDGFKIGLYFMLAIFGVIRFFMALFISQVFEDNYLLFLFIAIFCIEVIFFILVKFMKSFA